MEVMGEAEARIRSQIDDLVYLKTFIEASRYLSRGRALIKSYAAREILLQLSPQEFLQATRVDHSRFERVVEIIKGDSLCLL